MKREGALVAEWLSSWLAEQDVRGSIPRLATWISEIGYLLLPSRDMAEIPLKRRKSSIQPTKPTHEERVISDIDFQGHKLTESDYNITLLTWN